MFAEYLNQHDLTELLVPREGYRPFPRRQAREQWESLSKERREALLAWGEEAKAGYPMLTATQFLAFSRCGSRAQSAVQPGFAQRLKAGGKAAAVRKHRMAAPGYFLGA